MFFSMYVAGRIRKLSAIDAFFLRGKRCVCFNIYVTSRISLLNITSFMCF